jgi:hypothetical protein
MRIKTAWLALAATLMLGAIAYGALQHRGEGRAKGSAVTASGHVTGLYPGRHHPVWVQVHNPFARDARVRWVRTRVFNASPACPARSIAPRRSRGLQQLASGRWRHVRIPPVATRRARVRLMMRASAPDGCQGARFPLRFEVKLKLWGH